VEATTKESVIREMVGSLRAAGAIKAAAEEEIVKAILKREQLGSTGIGRGVAIPHAKHPSLSQPIGTVAIAKNGVNFNSLDNEPVHILVMLISPQDRPSEHLRALENVSKSLRDDTFCRFLRQSGTREEIWELLTEAEGNK
ncbi:MAG TPA: PTS sugar transporter subunit IIA, partial [Gemmatales bacterium]|nr:PTS sugar transporter subunit IIA [Gemmatales bacterium]